MPHHKFSWAPIGRESPEAAAAASLAAIGLQPDIALRVAPMAVAIDRIDDATPINPGWPGIAVDASAEDESQTDIAPPKYRPMFVLELHATSASDETQG